MIALYFWLFLKVKSIPSTEDDFLLTS